MLLRLATCSPRDKRQYAPDSCKPKRWNGSGIQAVMRLVPAYTQPEETRRRRGHVATACAATTCCCLLHRGAHDTGLCPLPKCMHAPLTA
eukprot:116705-Chlamydomonas_euryale.AAC.6